MLWLVNRAGLYQGDSLHLRGRLKQVAMSSASPNDTPAQSHSVSTYPPQLSLSTENASGYLPRGIGVDNLDPYMQPRDMTHYTPTFTGVGTLRLRAPR